MKKFELLDENSNLINSTEFEDNEPLFKDGEIKLSEISKLPNQEFLDMMDDGADVLIPYGENDENMEFIIQNPSYHTLEFVNNNPNTSINIEPKDVIGKSYGEIFPNLNELKFVDLISEVNKTGIKKEVFMRYYEDNALCASFIKVILKIEGKIYILVKRENDFNIIYKQEQNMFYNSSQAMAVMQDEKFVKVNKKYINILGLTKDEIIGKNFLFNQPNHLNPKNEDEIKEIYYKVLNREIFYYPDTISIINKKTGEKRYFEGNLHPVLFNQRPAVQFSGIDITDSIKTKIKSKFLEEALNEVEHVSKLAYITWNMENGFIWSDEIFNILEVSDKEMDEHNELINHCILKEDRAKLQKKIYHCIRNGGSFKLTTKIKTFKSNFKDIIIYGNFFKNDNSLDNSENNLKSNNNPDYPQINIYKAIGYVQDISETIENEKKLENALKEKEVLLKEVHHRVKNNLQIILSLLRLDERFNAGNPKETIEATKNRINSMADIHEKLYQSSDLAHVNLKEYIESEIEQLFKLYSIKHIKTEYNLKPIELNVEKVIPLGLIINEIVHNTIKYAFPNHEEGNLKVSLDENNENIELIIEDDGIGMPESFNLENSNTLGIIVITNLIKQIEGKIELLKQKGTGFKISFKNN